MIPPVVIGGSGGSGTRVIAELLRVSGFYMGQRLNVPNDALDFVAFYDRWVNAYNFGRSSMSAQEKVAMHHDFQCAFMQFKAGRECFGTQDWGWKNPRSMLVLPFLTEVFPSMRFIHLVRDGRDMVYSGNQNQFKKHAVAISSEAANELSECGAFMRFWADSNLLVAKYGDRVMGEHYMRIRFEDLCLNRERTLVRLGSFLGKTLDYGVCSALIKTPESLGRWRGHPENNRDSLILCGEKAMRYFAYLD